MQGPGSLGRNPLFSECPVIFKNEDKEREILTEQLKKIIDAHKQPNECKSSNSFQKPPQIKLDKFSYFLKDVSSAQLSASAKQALLNEVGKCLPDGPERLELEEKTCHPESPHYRLLQSENHIKFANNQLQKLHAEHNILVMAKEKFDLFDFYSYPEPKENITSEKLKKIYFNAIGSNDLEDLETSKLLKKCRNEIIKDPEIYKKVCEELSSKMKSCVDTIQDNLPEIKSKTPQNQHLEILQYATSDLPQVVSKRIKEEFDKIK